MGGGREGRRKTIRMLFFTPVIKEKTLDEKEVSSTHIQVAPRNSFLSFFLSKRLLHRRTYFSSSYGVEPREEEEEEEEENLGNELQNFIAPFASSFSSFSGRKRKKLLFVGHHVTHMAHVHTWVREEDLDDFVPPSELNSSPSPP